MHLACSHFYLHSVGIFEMTTVHIFKLIVIYEETFGHKCPCAQFQKSDSVLIWGYFCLLCVHMRATVAEGIEWSSSNLKVGSLIPSLPKSACRSVLEQDAEP